MGKDYLIIFVIRLSRYRGGTDLVDISIVSDTQLDLIQKAISQGWNTYLHEVMGKHSEVEVDLDDKEMIAFKVISEDQEEIKVFMKWFPDLWVGNFSIIDTLETKIDNMDEEEINEYF
jgi:hypothetical protein